MGGGVYPPPPHPYKNKANTSNIFFMVAPINNVHDSPDPEIIHSVEVIFKAVAIPFAANVLLPVVPGPAHLKVSEVIAIVTVFIRFTKVRVVPIS